MSEIALQAGASIGSLYQFFPDKESVAAALRLQHAAEFASAWEPIRLEAGRLTVPALVARLFSVQLAFVSAHRAFFALLDAPAHTRLPASSRLKFRHLVATFLCARRPDLDRRTAGEAAEMVLQILRSFNRALAEAHPNHHGRVSGEFQLLMRTYLTAKLRGHATARKA